jgi:hypothetical protein
VLDSCFTEASFAMTARPGPELSSPPAVTVQLTAIFIRFFAASTSRSWKGKLVGGGLLNAALKTFRRKIGFLALTASWHL